MALGFSALSNLTGAGALMVGSMLIGLIGVVSLVVIVFSLLWEAYEENQRRVHAWLSLRAQSAENAQGRVEECLHQIRGSGERQPRRRHSPRSTTLRWPRSMKSCVGCTTLPSRSQVSG